MVIFVCKREGNEILKIREYVATALIYILCTRYQMNKSRTKDDTFLSCGSNGLDLLLGK
jgi:hypothetical protein